MSIQEAINQINCARNREQISYQYSNFYRTASPTINSESFSKEIAIDDKEKNHRIKICTWIFNIIDHFDFSRQTAVICVDIFDRFMATRGNRCSPEFALLVATTSVFISTKVNEKEGLQAASLAMLSRNQFKESDIKKMEKEILHDLTWLIHPPTAASFVYPLLQLFPQEVSMCCKKIIYEYAQYITELAAFDSNLVDYPSSIIGFAALIICLEDVTMSDYISRSSKDFFLQEMNVHFKLSQLESLQSVQKILRSVLLDQQHQMGDNSDSDYDQVKYLRHYLSSPPPVSVFGVSQ